MCKTPIDNHLLDLKDLKKYYESVKKINELYLKKPYSCVNSFLLLKKENSLIKLSLINIDMLSELINEDDLKEKDLKIEYKCIWCWDVNIINKNDLIDDWHHCLYCDYYNKSSDIPYKK